MEKTKLECKAVADMMETEAEAEVRKSCEKNEGEFFSPCYAEDEKEAAGQLQEKAKHAAVLYLERLGYRILERDWSCKAGTVDIVAESDDGMLAFIEVKARISIEDGLPQDSVSAEKRHRYERIAGYFLKDWERGDIQVRFDILSMLVIGEDRALIRHHINAWGIE